MKIFLAPMEGVFDHLMRDFFTKIGGYDQCTTEFVRVTSQIVPDKIFYEYSPELLTNGFTPAGVPCFVQLLGGNPEMVAANAVRAFALGAPGVDLNFGCPARTVNNHDGGAAILKNPHRVYDITKAVVDEVRKAKNDGGFSSLPPITVKMRLGFSHPDWAVEIAQGAERAGAQWIVVHARTRNDGYMPPAHWSWIRKIKEAVRIPVVANGEIWTVDDYRRSVDETGCEDVMLGRGAMARPDLALQIKLLAHEKWQWHQTSGLIKNFLSEARVQIGDRYVLNRGKQWLRVLCKHYPEAEPIFAQGKTAVAPSELLGLL